MLVSISILRTTSPLASRFVTAALAALLILALASSSTTAATLLPPGQQQFVDANGKPYSGGTIAFYVPGTTTVKQTWSDPGQTTLNTNPVVLDSAGRAKIYGSGSYRMLLKDRYGNLVYDVLTADTSSSQISWGGTSTGTANAQSVAAATNFVSTDGQIVGFIAGFTNTGQLTVSANGSGAIPVLADTLSGSNNLTGQEVQAGAAVLLIYDATRGAFHLVGGAGGSGAGFGGQQSLTASNVTDLGLVPTHNVLVTGSATITSFGSSASSATPVYAVTFGGSGTLVAGSSLILPAGTLSYQSGDKAIVLYQGSGIWGVLSFTAVGSGFPAGMLQAFGTQACPAGWSAADGAALSRTDNARLYAAIGTAWGSGDGSTTFLKPDLRGFFLRGYDAGAGRDPGRGFATAQGDSVGPHGHTVPTNTARVGEGALTIQYPVSGGLYPAATATQNPTGTTETRPVNVAVSYCIKL